MEALEIFAPKVMRAQALLSFVQCTADELSFRVLFSYLQQNGIVITLLSEGPATDEARNLVLVISEDALRKIEPELETLQMAMRAQALVIHRAVAVVRILGPHFDIRPGVAGMLFKHMEQAGVRMLANSTTITTSLLVVFESELDKVEREIGRIFHMPKGR
jgi:aspartokinase